MGGGGNRVLHMKHYSANCSTVNGPMPLNQLVKRLACYDAETNTETIIVCFCFACPCDAGNYVSLPLH